MKDTDSIDVGPLRPERAAQAGELLAASHADYPSFRHVFPDPTRRSRILRSFMGATARDAAAHGDALVAADTNGFVGVALWLPPGTFPLSAARKARMVPALARVAASAPSSFAAFARLGAAVERAHPAVPVWSLAALGVAPRAQRRGVGTRLMAPVLARADDAGASCYLQTSDPANIAYYQRVGFRVIQPAIPALPGGPDYIGMERAPGGPGA